MWQDAECKCLWACYCGAALKILQTLSQSGQAKLFFVLQAVNIALMGKEA